MDFVNFLGLVWPESNTWAKIISLFDVNSYAWTILLFTVVLKLLLSPLDFLQRFYTNKTTRIQSKLQPELEKIQKRYGQNQTLLYQKQTELYKKNNFSMKGSCTVMLIYMVVTLTVFLTLFSSLQSISSYKIQSQFEELQQVYTTTYNYQYNDQYLGVDLTQDNIEEQIITKEQEKIALVGEEEVLQNKNNAISLAQDQVVLKYNEIKDSWFWIKNIWRADNPLVREVSSYSEYASATNTNVSEKDYNLVMAKLLNDNNNSVNGYFVLSVVVVLVSLLTQWVSKKSTQVKNSKGQAVKQPGMTKILMFILPIAMLLFTLRSSALFSLYIIVNSLMSAILTPIVTSVSNKIEDKKDKDLKEKNKAEYSR